MTSKHPLEMQWETAAAETGRRFTHFRKGSYHAFDIYEKEASMKFKKLPQTKLSSKNMGILAHINLSKGKVQG